MSAPRVIAVVWLVVTLALPAVCLSQLGYVARQIVIGILAALVTLAFVAWNVRIILRFWHLTPAEWAAVPGRSR